MSEATATVLDFPTVEKTNIFDRAVCLSLRLERLGTNRKMSIAELKPQTVTDAEMVNVSKKMLISEELDAIKKHDGAIRRWLETKVSGPALFRSGVYMLGYDMVAEVDRELQARLKERTETLIPRFLDRYNESVKEAQRRLGPLFRAEDYPTRDRVREEFSDEVRYFTLGEAQGLSRINAEIFEREKEKNAQQWASVLDESRAVLRAEVSELVDHMVERLTPDESGKKKRFNSTLVENLDGFLKDFAARDIANDTELQRVVDEARKALAGVTADDLRGSRAVREAARARFTEVKATLDKMVTGKGRAYNLDE